MINDGTTVVKRGKSEDTGVVIQIGWSENGNSWITIWIEYRVIYEAQIETVHTK
jgi:hypothetical protein